MSQITEDELVYLDACLNPIYHQTGGSTTKNEKLKIYDNSIQPFPPDANPSKIDPWDIFHVPHKNTNKKG